MRIAVPAGTCSKQDVCVVRKAFDALWALPVTEMGGSVLSDFLPAPPAQGAGISSALCFRGRRRSDRMSFCVNGHNYRLALFWLAAMRSGSL